jgi:hypothetical protein
MCIYVAHFTPLHSSVCYPFPPSCRSPPTLSTLHIHVPLLFYYYHHHHFRSQMSENMRYLAFRPWFILLSMMIFSSIHFLANNIISFSLWMNNITWCVHIYIYIYIPWNIYMYILYVCVHCIYYIYIYHIFFIHSSIIGYLDYLHSAMVTRAAVNRSMPVCWFILFQIYDQE